MRLSLATTACVVSVALLAGCSNSGMGTSSVPGGTSTSSMSRSHEKVPMPRFYQPSQLSKSHYLKMMASGQLPSRTLHDAFMKNYNHYLSNPKFRPAVSHESGTPALWNNLFDYSYMIGLNAKAKKALVSVSTAASSSDYCYYPQTAKVDSGGNVWTACEYANGTEGAALQEYNSSGTLVAQYTSGCPNGYSCDDYWFSEFFDAAVNNGTQCGVAPDYESETDSDSQYRYGSGLICFSSPSDPGTVHAAWECNQTGSCTGSECDPICEAWEGDADTRGDVYFTYEGENTSCFGGGLALYNSSNGAITSLQSPCLLLFPGGVWVGNGNAYVIDQEARMIYVYTLPITSSSTPSRVLGPTKVNITGIGDPDSGGVASGDGKMVIGDAYGWDDAGKIAGNKNKWKVLLNFDFVGTGVEGASYAPSDKP
jgi:hypothetical protein